MPSPLKRLGQRLLVWIVASSAMLQTAGQTIASAFDRRSDLVVLWLVITVIVAIAAATIENLKAFIEAS